MNILCEGTVHIRSDNTVACITDTDEQVELVPGQYLDVYIGCGMWAEMYYDPDYESAFICTSRKDPQDAGFFALARGSFIRLYDERYPYVLPKKQEIYLRKSDFEKSSDALKLRECCLEIANTIALLLYGNKEQRNSLTARLEMLDSKLIAFHIFPEMHKDTLAERYNDPLIVAQKVASQWKWALGLSVKSFSETLRIIQEFTENNEEVGDQNILILSGNDLHPEIQRFIVLRSFITLTYHVLDAQDDEKVAIRKEK